jgi:hypothetical protein
MLEGALIGAAAGLVAYFFMKMRKKKNNPKN